MTEKKTRQRRNGLTALPEINFQPLIAEAAYFMAESRGFEPGFELEDWLVAEREVLTGKKT